MWYWKMWVSSWRMSCISSASGRSIGMHHAEARRAGEGADALGDEVEDDVVLLERRMGGVVDQRDRVLDLEVELPRELVVGALGEGDHLLELRLLRPCSSRR